jgi:hypothetical protein
VDFDKATAKKFEIRYVWNDCLMDSEDLKKDNQKPYI